ADRNRSHWSTSKTPSYTKSVSWQHHPRKRSIPRSNEAINPIFLYLLFWIFIHPNKACMPYPFYDV
ncbi:hypothetical protein, partial [Escherichia coli]|uniref:hypothetical protein n=1 Tax=Escherichia coli TaxID=562 RepID=UPI001BC8A4AA